MKSISLFKGVACVTYVYFTVFYLTTAIALAHNNMVPIEAIQITALITGTVKYDGMPMAGVTVVVEGKREEAKGKSEEEKGKGKREEAKGKSIAVLTDADGKFSIEAKAGDVLVFSYTGFKTKRIAVDTQAHLSIVLDEDVTDLKEVVINAGYYKVKDKERTGSIVRIDAATIEKQPVTNVLATMQGRMAGVNIVQESGIAGGGFSISIRGMNSLRAGANAPLYLIDGVPYSSDAISSSNTSTSIPGDGNPLNSINPSDIESLEILKDADATAIYGSRGANGVVLITTKKGKSGKTKFTVNATHGTAKVTRLMDLMHTEDYLAMRRKAFANDGISTFPANAYDVNGTWKQDRYTDWQEKLTGGTAEIMGLQGSVSGGSEQTRYLLSGNYRTESSVFPGDFQYKRGGARLSFDHTSEDKKFRLNFSGSYMTQKNDLPSIDFVTLSRQLAPNAPELYDAQGNLNWENGSWQNPLANLESKYLSKTNDLVANALLSYAISEQLEFKTSLGFTDLRNNESRAVPSSMYNPASNLGSQYSSIYFLDLSRKSWIVEPQLHWNNAYGKSRIDVLAGATFQTQESQRLNTLASGFSSNSLLYNIASASRVVVANNDAIFYNYQAYFGRLNYTYAGKYIVNLTGRRDGSSRFGPGKQFATFGAAGAAWLFSNEAAISNHLPWLSFGKLRSSYGITGNDQLGDYQFLDTYSSSGFQYGNTNGLMPARLYNADFGWETNRKFEVALETGFLNDRLFLTLAYYKNRSSNQLVGLPIPGTTGFTSIQANLDATVENTGFEGTLRTVNIKTAAFEWNSSFNITVARNKLLSFPGLENSVYRNQYVIGEPTTIRKLFHFTGVDPQTGLYTFEDLDGDGAITYENDRETVKDFNPDFYGGLQNQFIYKGFQLDFLFQFVKQQNYTLVNTQRFAGLLSNQPVAYVDSWMQAGDSAPYQMYTTGVNQRATRASEFFAVSDGAVGDASFIRMKNISLSYDLPAAWLHGSACRLSLQAQNLFTITSFKGADPEFTQGGTLPPMRIVSGGVQLTF